MPSAFWSLCKEIDVYLKELEEGDRSPRTINDYRWSLTSMFQALNDFKYTVNPRKIGRTEIDFLRNEFYEGRTNQYRAGQIKRLIQFCKWAGNTDLARLKIGYGAIEPTNIKWLDDDQARLVRASAEGIERMVIHCELDLGMRRIEVLRLKVSDFKSGRLNTVHIHGKGRNGGKHRIIHWHPQTGAILQEYLEGYRSDVVQKAKRKDPSVKVPDSMFIYEWGGKLLPYKKTSMDSILKTLGARIGLDFSNHDLRRTCGRMVYRAGARIEQIMRIFGHADTRTTIHYLGLDFDDMSQAMDLYAQYQNQAIFPQTEIFEDSQKKGGPIGI